MTLEKKKIRTEFIKQIFNSQITMYYKFIVNYYRGLLQI
jgi:hypothetical protein